MYSQDKWYDERETFRAVTGGAFRFPMGVAGIVVGDGTPSGGQFPTKGTIPVANVCTGTISSNGVDVRGSSNADFSQIKIDDYLYDGDVVRRIKSVNNDPGNKLIELWEPFPSDLNGAAIRYCERLFFKHVYAKSTHASADPEIQEALFMNDDTFENAGSPISYDATTGQISFTCTK